jgi:hypothetical protein
LQRQRWRCGEVVEAWIGGVLAFLVEMWGGSRGVDRCLGFLLTALV